MAREIDAALAMLPVETPPAQFTGSVLKQVRHSPGWGEPRVQPWWMTAPLTASLALLVASIWLVVGGNGEMPAPLAALLHAAGGLVALPGHVTPALPPYAYAIASGVLVMTLMLWQWADEELS